MHMRQAQVREPLGAAHCSVVGDGPAGVVPAAPLSQGEQYLVLRALEELARSRRDECARLLGIMSYPGQDVAARRLMRGVDEVEALAARVVSSRVVLLSSPDGEVA